MNIQEAKTEIARTLRAYTRRRADGSHVIPPEKQRPVLLIGPPGIGKTAVMKQIAEETGCGLVAYAMTHHTRQSAIGLPFISQRNYGGVTCSVTEYTMSEIVAAIYDFMERTGKRSGILFLDEINCVSETLTPVMLQLLQNKTFGNVPLPEDWIIVAAGNPPEYNKSVRELDMVTLDRVKHIDVEADLAIWQRYARAQGVHPAIRAYLNICPDHFYRITDTDRGQFFVTARGWEDLSLMLLAYEEDGIEVSADWFMQYLQYDEIARSFSLFYDLFRSTANGASDAAGLSLAQRLLGEPDALAVRSATECLALASMLLHPVDLEATRIMEARRRLQRRRELASLLASAGQPDEASARAFLQQKRKALEVKAAHRTIKPEEELRESSALGRLEGDIVNWLKQPVDERSDFLTFEEGRLQSEGADLTSAAEAAAHAVEEAYQVLERCPNGHSALLYLTNDLAASEACADLLAAHPSPAFEKYRLEIE